MKIKSEPFGILKRLIRELQDLNTQGLEPVEINLTEREYKELLEQAEAGNILLMSQTQTLVDKQIFLGTPVNVYLTVDVAEVTQGLLDLANAGKSVLLSDEDVKKRRKKVKPEDYPKDE